MTPLRQSQGLDERRERGGQLPSTAVVEKKPAHKRFKLRARQVFPGRRFAALPTWLQVSIGTREETAAILEALREVAPAAKEKAA